MKRRKTQRRRGGGKREIDILEKELKSWLMRVFASHRPTENLIVPYKASLFFHVKLQFEKDVFRGIDIEISPNSSDRVFLHNDGCHLGVHVNSPKERLMPWGEYVHPEVMEKGINIQADFNFALTCTPYQGSKYTNFLFMAFFYILKLHASFMKRPDYIIAADDASYSNGRMLTDVIVEKVVASKMRLSQIMKTPVLYYERFGFTYPEKKEFFTNLINTGDGFITNRGQKEKYITRYYLDLSTISAQTILNNAYNLTTRG